MSYVIPTAAHGNIVKTWVGLVPHMCILPLPTLHFRQPVSKYHANLCNMYEGFAVLFID